jgi:hypothetical protein
MQLIFIETMVYYLKFILQCVPYYINQPSKLCWIQMQMGGTYAHLNFFTIAKAPCQMSIILSLL